MKIRCTNPGTSRLWVPEYMEKPVEFKNGVATVPEVVGARMVKDFSVIEEVKPAKKPRKVSEDV